MHEQVKAEMHQIVVEVGSNFCENVTEARKEVSFLRNKISGLAGNQSLLVGVASTYPFPDGKIRKSQTIPDTIIL